MSLKHSFHHAQRDFKLWRMNRRLALGIRNKDLTEEDDEFTFCCAKNSMVKELDQLHLRLFRMPLAGWIKWLYKFNAADFVSVAIDKQGRIAGYDMFIFNESEVKSAIIHEPFVGIHPDYQNRGLAARLRLYSARSYDFGVLSGISTVAPYDDIKALRSAQKAGFAIHKASVKPQGYYMFKFLTKKF